MQGSHHLIVREWNVHIKVTTITTFGAKEPVNFAGGNVCPNGTFFTMLESP
jgi:hypothetical protein